MIGIHDDVLQDAQTYREAALRSAFSSIDFGTVLFHGIATPPDERLERWVTANYQSYEPITSFLRKSPAGQVEPNFIHNDVDMGDLTVVLYLSQPQPEDDGTSFWRFLGSGAQSSIVALSGEVGHRRDLWRLERTIPARFNRAVVFSSHLFHSRAREENFGEGDNSRLVQVCFARRRN